MTENQLRDRAQRAREKARDALMAWHELREAGPSKHTEEREAWRAYSQAIAAEDAAKAELRKFEGVRRG